MQYPNATTLNENAKNTMLILETDNSFFFYQICFKKFRIRYEQRFRIRILER